MYKMAMAIPYYMYKNLVVIACFSVNNFKFIIYSSVKYMVFD